MPAVHVPDLKRKFALLRAHSTRRTWPALAEPFGKSFKTLQFWQDKSASREAGLIPDWAVPILTRLIGEVLPGDRLPDEVRQFVFGPAAPLEEEVRTGAATSIMALLAAEARRDTATLMRREASVGLVEVETEDREPCPRLRLGEPFRIVVRRRLSSGYVVALQHAQRAWTLLPTALTSSPPATILVPGVTANGTPSFMCERRDLGRHLFACLESTDPPPAWVLAFQRDGITLDKRALDALAAFYSGQDTARRACHTLHVEITPDAST